MQVRGFCSGVAGGSVFLGYVRHPRRTEPSVRSHTKHCNNI